MKTVVFNSEHQEQVLHIGTGRTFVSGVPQDVTDEDAEKLLEVHPYEYLEGDDETIAALKRNYALFKPTPNPNFGKQKDDRFSLADGTSSSARSYEPAPTEASSYASSES